MFSVLISEEIRSTVDKVVTPLLEKEGIAVQPRKASVPAQPFVGGKLFVPF